MAADDHLSSAQFHPIEQFAGMRSQVPGMTVEESYYHSPTRWGQEEQEYAKAKGYSTAQEYHEALKAHMRSNGQAHALKYGFDDPRDASSARLMNGHHRYYAARDLGWRGMYGEPFKPQREAPVKGWDE